ncbi:MAG: VOC family protein [Halobacteriaceae archaeon]
MAPFRLPSATRLGRVGLTAADVAALTDFYTDVIGLSVHRQSEARVVIGAEDGPSILVVCATEAPARPADAAGLFHLAIRVPDRAALGAVLERVEASWELLGASDHGVSEALYLRDPEGNGVEVYRDRPKAEWPRDETGAISMYTRPLDLAALRAAAAADEALDAATIGHIHLEVTDIEAARQTYVDGLGFEVMDTWGPDEAPDALFVAAGGYHHHVGVNTWEQRTSPMTGRGLAWFEVVVPEATLATLETTLEQLSGAAASVTHEDGRLTVTDPDGIVVRIRSGTASDG